MTRDLSISLVFAFILATCHGLIDGLGIELLIGCYSILVNYSLLICSNNFSFVPMFISMIDILTLFPAIILYFLTIFYFPYVFICILRLVNDLLWM